MKIKGEIEDLKIKNCFKKEEKTKKNDHKNSKNISRSFSGVVVGCVGVHSFLDISLVWLVFLKMYRPLLYSRY